MRRVTPLGYTPAHTGARPLDVAAAGSYIGLSELAKSSLAGRVATARNQYGR
jgi:hypothetical protein